MAMIDPGVFFIALPVKTQHITACTLRATALEPISE
jgi:kynurenine formamidase